ncbi:BCCT family transporter [Ignatzschineria sp. LJL83]
MNIKKLLNWALIDSYTFFGALFLLLLVVIPLIIWPEAGDVWISQAKMFVTDKFGIFYLLMGLSALFFLVYIFFSDIGYIKLGEEDCEPEFSTASWGAMLFSSGIGASILYLGSIEWAYYYISPPFNVESGSAEAVVWASTYGMFHWGLIAWAIYLVPAIPIAYFFYVRKEPVLKISVALKPVLGEKHSNGYIGKTIDILFIFGILGGGATSLGLASPLITEGLHKLFGLPMNIQTQVLVLLITTIIFAYSAYAGLKRGIQFLSNVTIWGAVILLLFIFIAGPTVFIMNTSISSVGHMFDNFFSMATWTEPFGGLEDFPQSNFPQDWTIFYWAWWLVFAPTIGLFIARVSKGRTIRNMIAGSITLGALGCAFFFFILGNYGLHLQLSGELDLVMILKEQGDTAAIYAMLESLPFSPIVIGLFTILAVIFTATTFDSMSYILAAVVQKNIEDEPLRWNRLFWAFALSFMPITLMFVSQITGINSLSTLQTASVVAGVPLLVIITMLMVSISRVAKVDLEIRDDYQNPTINIENLPEVDPWSEEYAYLEKFNKLKVEAIEAAENERNVMNEIMALKVKIRDRSVNKFSIRDRNFRITSSEVSQLSLLETALIEAKLKKEASSLAAQTARIEFKECRDRKQESIEAIS